MLSINGSLVLYAVPLFWLGMLLFYLFATRNGIALFPGQQMVTPGPAHHRPRRLGWLTCCGTSCCPPRRSPSA